MRILKSIFGDRRAGASASKKPSMVGTTSDDKALIQRQLAVAQKEAQNALADWRSYPTRHYEIAWIEASAKVRELEAKVPKRNEK